MRQSEENLIARVIRDFKNLITCAPCCGLLRQSLHEVVIMESPTKGILTPMNFESYETDTALPAPKEFTFKNNVETQPQNPFHAAGRVCTKVSLS